MGKSNPHASNAVDSLFNGANAGKRVQTVLTPPAILDPLGKLWPEGIGFDPCHFEGSLVKPAAHCLVPWDRVWRDARSWAAVIAPEIHGEYKEWQCAILAATVYALLRSEIRAKDVPKKWRAKVSEAARNVRAHLRRDFEHTSGHAVPWLPRTFCNPPFGDRGPETVLATFKDFCEAFARATNETVFLCPVRCQRKWWRRDILDTADAITYLNPITFEGFDQSFPAPLCLAHKFGLEGIITPNLFSARVDLVREIFAHLGDTYPRS